MHSYTGESAFVPCRVLHRGGAVGQRWLQLPTDVVGRASVREGALNSTYLVLSGRRLACSLRLGAAHYAHQMLVVCIIVVCCRVPRLPMMVICVVFSFFVDATTGLRLPFDFRSVTSHNTLSFRLSAPYPHPPCTVSLSDCSRRAQLPEQRRLDDRREAARGETRSGGD